MTSMTVPNALAYSHGAIGNINKNIKDLVKFNFINALSTFDTRHEIMPVITDLRGATRVSLH